MPKSVQVTQSYLPPVDEFEKRICAMWESDYLTNLGINILELKSSLKEKLSQKPFLSVITNREPRKLFRTHIWQLRIKY